MTTALATTQPDAKQIEAVLIRGDLSTLTESQRLSYYHKVCESLGLNPLTQPFDYLKLSGRTVLYAKRDATEQLRKIHGVSITDIETRNVGDCYMVIAKASDRTGRTDASTGVVPIGNLKGENLANALMKAETKAKRRVTLSICGLGTLDETELDTIKDAQPVGYSVEAPPERPDHLRSVESREKPSAPNGGDSATTPDSVAERADAVNVILSGPRAIAGSTPAAVTIRRIDTSETRNKNVTKCLLSFSTGEQASTINKQLASLAEQICQEGTPVRFTTKATKWGDELVTLERALPEAWKPFLEPEPEHTF